MGGLQVSLQSLKAEHNTREQKSRWEMEQHISDMSTIIKRQHKTSSRDTATSPVANSCCKETQEQLKISEGTNRRYQQLLNANDETIQRLHQKLTSVTTQTEQLEESNAKLHTQVQSQQSVNQSTQSSYHTQNTEERSLAPGRHELNHPHHALPTSRISSLGHLQEEATSNHSIGTHRLEERTC